MPGETDLHKTLKKEACRWLFRMGYRCIAAEVRLKSVKAHGSLSMGFLFCGCSIVSLTSLRGCSAWGCVEKATECRHAR